MIEQAIRQLCITAGITGTDLDTALTSWAKHPMGADGIRVQRVIEARREQRTPESAALKRALDQA